MFKASLTALSLSLVACSVLAQASGGQARGINQSAGSLAGIDPVARAAAIQIVDVVEADMTKYGAERVLNEMRNPRGVYVNGDTLAFVVDRRSNFIIAHPIHGAEAAKKSMQQIHDSDNRPFGKEILTQVQAQGWAYVRIRYPSGAGNRLILKSIVCRPDRSALFLLCGSAEERI